MVQRNALFITAACLLGLVLFCFPTFSMAQHESYGIGSWDSDSLGNHRAVVEVSDSTANAAYVRINWRRRDKNPEEKRIIVVDAETNQKINNVYRADINRITGDLIFEPVSGAGTYYVYYMPNKMEGRSNYPTIVYPEPEFTAENCSC